MKRTRPRLTISQPSRVRLFMVGLLVTGTACEQGSVGVFRGSAGGGGTDDGGSTSTSSGGTAETESSSATATSIGATGASSGRETEGTAGDSGKTAGESGSSDSEMSCLGIASGDALYDDGLEYSVFDGCDGGFLVEKRGQYPSSPGDVLDGIFLPGSSVVPCCPERELSCIRIAVQASDFSFESLVDGLRQVLGDDGGCVGLQIEPIGFAGPRCRPDDPACAPVPYCDSVTTIDCPAYEPATPRVPVAPDFSSNTSCAHDGECVYNALECKSWMDPFLESWTPLDLGLESAFCGCVEGGCQWFEHD